MRSDAEILLKRISTMNIKDDYQKNTLYKHAILAFETLKIKKSLNTLRQANKEDLDELLKAFSGIDEVEAAHYYNIISK